MLSKISDLVFNSLSLMLSLFLKSSFTVASLREPSFRKRLGSGQFTLLIKTRDGRNARYFKLIGGMPKTRKADYSDPDFSLVWTETREFNAILRSLNPMKMMKGLMEALESGKLVIRVNLETTRWFVSMVAEMLHVYRHFFSFKRG